MKKLLILSGKGGTGKTTTASSFIRFADAKAFADCDVDAPNLHIVSQMDTEPKVSDFIGSEKADIDENLCTGCGICAQKCRFDAIAKRDNGKFEIKEFACEGCGVCELVCPVGAAKLHSDIAGRLELFDGSKKFSTATLKMGRGNSGKLVSEVKKSLDLIVPKDTQELMIIDGSPGIGCPVIASVNGVDLALIVSEPSLSGFSDLERLVKTADMFQTKVAVCVNRYDTNVENTEKIKNFCKEHEIAFVGKVPYDKEASKAINEGKTLADVDCEARDALMEVYKNTLKVLGI